LIKQFNKRKRLYPLNKYEAEKATASFSFIASAKKLKTTNKVHVPEQQALDIAFLISSVFSAISVKCM